ncbi:glycosyltransferase [Bacillus sp. E214]|uniref:glycosyltransferase n=1 Tax=Bacillus sp. E214 TaxID=2587156 RepID=UPI0011E06A46|nr:glycosyltransferase [Bacillus sp. E214]
MKPKMSIVVPVYNVEKYLDKCIQSLIDQTYKDIEIILVNDGSPDNCPQICESYEKRDPRVITIHKENGGLSDARNAGLKTATGEYILFVDSDDFIELNTCEMFVKVISNKRPDIIVGNAKRIEENHTSPMCHNVNNNGQILTGEDYLKRELKKGNMYMAAWLNLYKRDFLIINNLEFEVGLLHEDEHFTPRAFLKAKKVLGTDITFYNYLIRAGSITNQKGKIKNAEHIIKICKELERLYSEIKDNELKSLLNDNLVQKYLNTFQVAGLHRKQYKYLVDKNFLKRNAYTKRTKLKVVILTFSKHLYYYLNIINNRL